MDPNTNLSPNDNNSSFNDQDDYPNTYCSPDLITSTTGIILLMCSSVGVFFNVISIVIYKQRIMSTPINLMLAALCCEDVVVLVLAVPILGLTNLQASCLTYIPNFDRIYTICVCYLYPIMMMAQSASVWTFVLISLERFNVICRPLHRHRWFSKRKASRALCYICLCAVLYNAIRFWQFTYDKNNDGALQHLLYSNKFYFKYYYTAAYVLFLFVIPFTLLLILNISVVRTIYKSGQDQAALGTKEDIRSRRSRQQYRITLMIVLVTTLFATCNVLPFVLNIWEAVDKSLFMKKLSFYLLDLSNLLVLLNCSAGPFFYLYFCDRYRYLFVCIFTCSSLKSGQVFSQYYSEIPAAQSPALARVRSVSAAGCQQHSLKHHPIYRSHTTIKKQRSNISTAIRTMGEINNEVENEKVRSLADKPRQPTARATTHSAQLRVLEADKPCQPAARATPSTQLRVLDYPHRRLSADLVKNTFRTNQIVQMI